MRLALASLIASLPLAALAAGSGSNAPPAPTETTLQCEDGLVWDAETETCVAPQDARFDDLERYDAVRELAYAGRLDDAQRVLRTMDQSASDTQTYWGFTHRKLGNFEAANSAYDAALRADPDNLLARSYLGQAHVAQGNLYLARAELTQIRRRGGRDTWAEISLRLAISSGQGFSY